jgi:hypothetical protein
MWTIYDALVAFFEEHRRCGWLDRGVEHQHVAMTCDCGAVSTCPIDQCEEAI